MDAVRKIENRSERFIKFSNALRKGGNGLMRKLQKKTKFYVCQKRTVNSKEGQSLEFDFVEKKH